MRKSTYLVLLGATLGGATSAWSEPEPRIYRSAYFLGRGDTGIANADDEDAIFYNPAGIAQGKGIYKRTVLASPHVEMSRSAKDAIRQVAMQDGDPVDTAAGLVGEPVHAGASNFTGLILRRAALGAFASSSVDVLAFKDPDAGGLETVRAQAEENIGLTFSLADGFWNNTLMLGVTGKYLQRGRGEAEASLVDADQLSEQLEDEENFIGMGKGTGADVGLMYRMPGKMLPSFGLTVSDVGDTSIAPDEETNIDLDIKQTINAGFAIEPGTKYSKLKLLADVRDIGGRVQKNDRKKIHLGGELSVINMVGLTAGLNQGYPTAGIYFDLWLIRLDAGMYTEEVGERVGTRPDERYFVRIRAGF